MSEPTDRKSRTHRVRPGFRSAGQSDSRIVRGSLRLRLSHQHLQHHRAWTLRRPAGYVCPYPGGPASLEYADLKRHFEGKPAPTLAEVREAVRQIRARKGMLIVEGDPDCRSAGSFFKNPVLSEEQHQDLERRAAEERSGGPELSGAGASAKSPQRGWSSTRDSPWIHARRMLESPASMRWPL